MVHLNYEDSIISESCNSFEAFKHTKLVHSLVKRLKIIQNLATEEEQSTSVLNVMISEAFTKFNLSLIGDYAKFINFSKSPKRTPKFQMSKYLSCASDDHREFLNEFVNTAMLQNFIQGKLRASLRPCERKRCKFESTSVDSTSENVIEKFKASQKVPKSAKNEDRPKLTQPIFTTNYIKPFDEVTIQLTGKLTKTLQVPPSQTFRHLHQRIKTMTGQPCQLMVQYSVPPSPTANIGEVFQIFKNEQGVLQIFVDDFKNFQ